MVEIPAEIQIKSTIQPGSVFYFSEETFASREPHFFIVLNKQPLTETLLLFVCSSTQIETVKKRRKHLPPATLVVIKKEDYCEFAKDSIIDCNYIVRRPLNLLIKKLESKKLIIKDYIKTSIIDEIRNGVLASPLVEKVIKNMLR